MRTDDVAKMSSSICATVRIVQFTCILSLIKKIIPQLGVLAPLGVGPPLGCM